MQSQTHRYRSFSSRLTRFAVPAVAAAALCMLPACGEEETAPEEQIDSGLEQLEAGIDKMRSEKENLAEAADSLQNQLKDSSQKQVNLWQSKLHELGSRVTELPAEKEQDFQGRLDKLRQNVSEMKSSLEHYTDDATEDSKQAWQELKSKMDELKSTFDSFTSDLESALAE